MINREARHKRIRSRLSGTAERPRFSVFRSSRGIYAQIIDDVKGRTIVAAKYQEVKDSAKKSKIETARDVGKMIALKALKENIKDVVFDRGGYKYHGRVKALAEGAKEEGLNF